MKNRNQCPICHRPKSAYILSNRRVCLLCDELLFDMEIECDDEPIHTKKEAPAVLPSVTSAQIKKIE